ncbi:zinc finger protein 185 isoform X2 [Anolis carolinensis]|uniref:zinc finger protein 185 isoform X2 n=1 Tax=Anolis carolinensis TaxID=28377 RepID=UPI002F2B3B3E
MLSLSTAKDGVIPPTEGDRKKIITQMKVRTTLRGDKSWIQKKSDSDDEQNHSPLRHSPLKTTGRSPPASRTLSPSRRIASPEPSSQAESKSSLTPTSPSRKSTVAPTGYLIRGVFTKTIDKTPASNATPNGSPTSAKNSSVARSSQGYKMSTDEYKKLAPYNIKRELSDPGEEEPSVSPDEQKKRTEAASSVLRRTANKERSYVLSAAKKSNGSSPTQDAPSFLTKRTDVEDESSPRSRSQTVPASAWFSSREKSINVVNKNRASQPTESSSTFNHFSSKESSPKPDQEKHQLISFEVSPSPSKRSEKNDRTSQTAPSTETQNTIFSEHSWETRKPNDAMINQTPPIPHIAICPAASPKTSTLNHKEEDFNRDFKYSIPSPQVVEQPEHQSLTSKTQAFARDPIDSPSESKYKVPSRFDSNEDDRIKRSSSGFERKFMYEMADDSPSDTEYKKVEAYLATSGSWSSESSLSTSGTPSELPRNGRRDGSELETPRPSSFSAESGLATPESQQGENGSDSDTPRYSFPSQPSLSSGLDHGISEASYRIPRYLGSSVYSPHLLEGGRSRTLSYLDRRTRNTFRLSESTHARPSYLNYQSYNRRMLEMKYGITSRLYSQALNSERTYHPFRDGPGSGSPRSHRTPFYRDSFVTDNRRNVMGSETNAINAPLHFKHPLAPGYESDHTTSRNVMSSEMRSINASPQFKHPLAPGYDSDHTTSSKGLLFVKESVNTTELSSSPRYNSRSLADLSELEKLNYSTASYLNSSPSKRPPEDICTYCGREIRNCPKITIDKPKICCHDYCFRCGICHKPMGDLLDKIFIHRDIVHCDKCYEKLF